MEFLQLLTLWGIIEQEVEFGSTGYVELIWRVN